MKARNVLLTLILVLVAFILVITRFRGSQGKELFDRHPAHLYYTHHALCRMDCRHISKQEINEIMERGIINLNKSDQYDRPCPTYALQGTTDEGESIRVIFAQCSDETKVVTCYNLKEDFECHCPGDENKKPLLMRFLVKPLMWLYTIYAFLLFVVLMIPVFLWALVVSPLGKIRGGNLVYKACIVWADVWFALVFIWHRNIYIEPVDKDQSYIFVANHISYLDAALIPKVFRHPIRPLGKVEMSKIPLFGFIYKNAIVSVDRTNPRNRAKSVQALKSVLRKGISILVFPEGTFNTTHEPLKKFYDGAFRIAIETGTPIRPVLFLDTYSRLHYKSIFSFNPGRSRALFLPAVPVNGMTLEDVHMLKTFVYHKMEAALKENGYPQTHTLNP